MHQFLADFALKSTSPRVPTSPRPPTDDAIEAIIQQATSARPSPDSRPLRDTRTQLFVGNLPYRVRWQDLKDLFRKAGTVLRADVSLGPDNRSRGYGTVLLATAEDAGRAVDMFNGYSWQTRVLEVRLDRLLPDFDSLASSSASSSSSQTYLTPTSKSTSPPTAEEMEFMSLYHANDPNSCRNLFVGNLPFHCQWQDLKDLFRQAGTVLRADVALGPDGRSRGFGTVVFATDYDAVRAVKMFNGYDYNSRILKVHFDKFSTATLATPASPLGTNPSPSSHTHNPPTQIKLPPGFVYDYGTPSGPSSPFELFSQLQQQHQLQLQRHQQSQLLHQPQAQHLLQHTLHSSRQQPHQQPHLRLFGSQSGLDVDGLTTQLASTQFSAKKSPQPQLIHKSPIISTTSSGSASTSNTTSSSSERSLSTSASSVSHSPTQNQSQQQQEQSHQQELQYTHSYQQQQPRQQHLQQPHQPRQHHHPRHPGPITLPPPPPVSFPNAPYGQISPLHHPNLGSPYGSPYHLYPSSSAAAHAYHQHQQSMTLTPQGLPPITPSMPPFTFLPPLQHPHQRHPGMHSDDIDASSSSSSQNTDSPASTAARSSSARASSTATGANTGSSSSKRSQGRQQPPMYAVSGTPHAHFHIPLPSPGLILPAPAASPQYPHPHPYPTQHPNQHPQGQHHPQQPPTHPMQLQLQLQQPPPLPSPPVLMRLNLAGVHSAFSPGVAMSPGTFYGRPGDVPGPNPHINAAVGAPVHVVQMHSPLGMVHMQQQQQQGQPGPMPHGGHPTHGAYFYAMSSPKKGPPTGMEPQGYFDPMYFPVGAVVPGTDAESEMETQSKSQALQTSGLANEVVQDGVEQDKERERKRGSEDDGEEVTVEKKDSGSTEESMSPLGGNSTGSGSLSSGLTESTSWHASDAGGGEMDSATTDLSSADPDTTISRAHSVGHIKEPRSKVVPEDGLEMRMGVLDLKLPERQQPPESSP